MDRKITYDLDHIESFAVNAAREAGSILISNLGSDIRCDFKGEIDLVTDIDRKVEDLIVSAINETFPDHGILAEEGTEHLGESSVRWIIDPIDGTTNYAHGFPFFCVSIAFESDGEVVSGVVYDPIRDELFTARIGEGSFLNGAPLDVSKTDTLAHSLLATGFPYDIRTSTENNLDNFARFAVTAQAIRRAGSAALDLCYVACGRFDGFWEIKLQPWDIAAASLIVTEAGGIVTDFDGLGSTIHNKKLVASNGRIHDQMLSVLRSH